jgi:hypothetical protein
LMQKTGQFTRRGESPGRLAQHHGAWWETDPSIPAIVDWRWYAATEKHRR